MLKLDYRWRTIISCGLHIFYPIFHCGFYCRAVSITDNLCTKKGNLGLKSVVYNQELVIMARVRYMKKAKETVEPRRDPLCTKTKIKQNS